MKMRQGRSIQKSVGDINDHVLAHDLFYIELNKQKHYSTVQRQFFRLVFLFSYSDAGKDMC
jgi:hypothetical protein